VQLLFSTGKSFTVDGLRGKLREFFPQEVSAASRGGIEQCGTLTALLSCNRQLASIGLQLRIINGVVSLLTAEVHKAGPVFKQTDWSKREFSSPRPRRSKHPSNQSARHKSIGSSMLTSVDSS
jgi:hypothetical protein